MKKHIFYYDLFAIEKILMMSQPLVFELLIIRINLIFTKIEFTCQEGHISPCHYGNEFLKFLTLFLNF